MEISIEQIDDKILEFRTRHNEIIREKHIPADRGKTARRRLDELRELDDNIEALIRVKSLLIET